MPPRNVFEVRISEIGFVLDFFRVRFYGQDLFLIRVREHCAKRLPAVLGPISYSGECDLRWLDTVKNKMQDKPFDTPILCIFNLYSRNNDEHGQNNTFSFDLAYLQKYIVRCYGNTHVLIFSEYGLLAPVGRSWKKRTVTPIFY